jgi:hypothetical protein
MGSEYGYIDDNFGNCWAKCKKDCTMTVVRPGKVQCDECDSKCPTCGGTVKYYDQSESPYERVSGYLCLECTDKWNVRR